MGCEEIIIEQLVSDQLKDDIKSFCSTVARLEFILLPWMFSKRKRLAINFYNIALFRSLLFVASSYRRKSQQIENHAVSATEGNSLMETLMKFTGDAQNQNQNVKTISYRSEIDVSKALTRL